MSARACLLICVVTGVCVGLGLASGASKETVSPLALHGTFLWPPLLDSDQLLSDFFDEIQSLGMNIVVVSGVRQIAGDECPSNNFQWIINTPFTEWLASLLHHAQRTSVSVYLGASSSGPCWNFYQEPQLNYTLTDIQYVLNLIPDENLTSLAGWFIFDEAGVPYWTEEYVVLPYYTQVTTMMKSRYNIPVTVSPYLNGARTMNVTPATIAERAALFAATTGVDIQIWQDSVGADAINVFNRDDYTLADYYSALADVLPIFWSDNEAFNWGLNLEGGGYASASLGRFKLQLEQTIPYAAKFVTWIQQTQFGTVDTAHCDESKRMLSAYKSWFSIQDGYIQLPFTYRYGDSTKPVDNHPDTELTKLSDGLIGDPTTSQSENWVAVQGDAEIIVDVGPDYGIDWVAVHLLSLPDEGILFPAKMALAVSRDYGSTWVDAGSWKLLPAQAQSEYVFGNLDQLRIVGGGGSQNTLLRIVLSNSGWTFFSELEMTVDP
ncbi:hypothetical protein Pelo_11941 [Pelomyxa schiedti]|nr:hypothetical protein Pelo_11941 [Pelomyxa schiedti]